MGGHGSVAPAGTVSFLDASDGNAVLGAAALGAGVTGLNFVNSSNPVSGQYPSAIAIGDFNLDGMPDLAVANEYSDALTILLGNGDGTFTPTAISPATGITPASIAVADFNGDGILDLAVVNFSSNTVTILLGNGDGTFTPTAVSPATGDLPIAITAADFNGDGISDLAVANYYGNTVTILLGKGDGTFTHVAASPGTGEYPVKIVTADFNGDGIPDLAVLNNSGETYPLTVLLGNGDGTFTPTAVSPKVGNLPYSMVVADFNGDGIPDLATANLNADFGLVPGTVTVLLGNGDGTFTPTAVSPSTGLSPFSMATGDFNGDGIPDIVVADYADGVTATVLLGNGDGTFTPSASPAATSDGDLVAAADFNGDGVSDFALGFPVNTLGVFLAEDQTATATATGISPTGAAPNLAVASYPGDNIIYVAGESGPITLKITPTIEVSPSVNPLPFGTPETFTATVTARGATPTGTISFYNGTAFLRTVALDNGVATYSTDTLPGLSASITARYSGDSNYGPGTSNPVTISILRATPTISLTPAADPASYGTPVGLTAQVSGTVGTPTGIVRFTYGETVLGTAALNSLGVATYSVSGLAVGQYNIKANYPGDTIYPYVTSAGIDLVVKKASQTITFLQIASPVIDVSGAPIALTATASSGLPSTYSVTGPASVSGSTLTILGFGAVAITAYQNGNAEYDPAKPITRTIVIEPPPPPYSLRKAPHIRMGS